MHPFAQQQTALIPVSSIYIRRDSRQRRLIDTDAGGLKASITKRGVLVPIIVTEVEGRVELVAGERRLTACLELGLELIPVVWRIDLSPTENKIIELEENLKRQDLPWQDLVRSLAEIHELFLELDPTWTMTQTAEECSVSLSLVSKYLTVSASLTDPNIAQSGTVMEAYNMLSRRAKRAEANTIQELLDLGVPEESATLRCPSHEFVQEFLRPGKPEGDEAEVDFDSETDTSVGSNLDYDLPTVPNTPRGLAPSFPTLAPIESIVCADFLEWIKTYSGRKFNLIHCDFPYGIGVFNSNGIRTGEARSQMGQDEGESYDDSPETYKALVVALATNLDKILSISGHIMFWFSNKFEIEKWTRETFAELAPSIEFSRYPLIWHKSDNAGIAAVPMYEPRHTYECALLGGRGKRPIVRLKADSYAGPTDKSLHVSAKPEPMLRHFMEMLVDEHTTLFDPTCGSGTALRAAESLGAKFVFGLESRSDMAEKALVVLRTWRLKRELGR